MAPLLLLLFARDTSTTSSATSGVKIGSLNVPIFAIAGFSLVAAILLALVVFFAIRFIRVRARRKREEKRDSAFLVVKGIVKDSGLAYKGPSFNRNNLTASVVLPEKAIINPNATNDDILSYYQQQGSMPRPFAPFSFALNSNHVQGGSGTSSSSRTAVGTLPSPAFKFEDKRVSTQSFSASAARLPPSPTSPSHRFPSHLVIPGPGPTDNHSELKSADKERDSIADSFFNVTRGSRTGSLFGFKFGHNGPGNTSSSSVVGRVVEHLRSGSASTFGGYRFSVISGRSSLGGESYTNSTRGPSAGSQRPVRQLFTPILPDELSLALGEKVAVLQSFDDGWCVVARSTTAFGGKEGEVEMGAVPAWCFVKPMKGLRSERPVRSSSLGVTVQMEDEARPREDIISWSNF